MNNRFIRIYSRVGMQVFTILMLPVLFISATFILISLFRVNSLDTELTKNNVDMNSRLIGISLETEIKSTEYFLATVATLVENHFNYQEYRENGDTYLKKFRRAEEESLKMSLANLNKSAVIYLILNPGNGDKKLQILWFYGNLYFPEHIVEAVNSTDFDPDNGAQDYYYRPLRTGKPYWSDVINSEDSGTPSISYSLPLRSEEKIIGVIGLLYTGRYFRETLSRYRTASTYPVLISEKNVTIYHPDLIFKTDISYLTDSEFLKERHMAARQKAAKGIPHYHKVVPYEDGSIKKYMGMYELSNRLILGVVTLRDSNELAGRKVLRFIGILGFAALIILSALVSFVSIHTLIKPLTHIHKEINKSIEDNNYYPNLSDLQQRKDEIGAFSRAFQRFSEKNQNSMAQLIHENINKTRLAMLGDKIPEMSHEIEGKLGTVNTAVSFVRDELTQKANPSDGELDFKDQITALDLALSSSQYASRIMRSLKNSSATQLHTKINRFNLKTLVIDVTTSLSYLAQNKDITYAIDISEFLMFTSYSGFLTQTLDNLISNSLRHGFKGRNSGCISIKASLENENLILIYKDDGSGIPDEDRDKVFERFYTTAKGSGGTGLGLSLLKKLVEEKMLGSIELLDCKTSGTEFHIMLPDLHQIPEDEKSLQA